MEQAYIRVHRIKVHKIGGLELEVKATDLLPSSINYSEINNINSWLIYQFYKYQRKKLKKETMQIDLGSGIVARLDQTRFVEVCKPHFPYATTEFLTLLLQLPPLVYLALRWSWLHCTVKPKRRWEPENDPEQRWSRVAHMTLDFENWNTHGPMYQ